MLTRLVRLIGTKVKEQLISSIYAFGVFSALPLRRVSLGSLTCACILLTRFSLLELIFSLMEIRYHSQSNIRGRTAMVSPNNGTTFVDDNNNNLIIPLKLKKSDTAAGGCLTLPGWYSCAHAHK